MGSFRTHRYRLKQLLNMLERGRLLSRKQAAMLFGCSERSVTSWLNELREEHDIRYSRALQRYILIKEDKK